MIRKGQRLMLEPGTKGEVRFVNRLSVSPLEAAGGSRQTAPLGSPTQQSHMTDQGTIFLMRAFSR
jgi:hypothetical protein